MRNRFDGRWSHGFVVTEVVSDGDADAEPRFRVARRSDASVLPADFGADEVREERRRKTWWQ